MEHTIPESHKELLQEILKCLILTADTEATFLSPVEDPGPEPEEKTIGK